MTENCASSANSNTRFSHYLQDCFSNNSTPVNWLAMRHGPSALAGYILKVTQDVKANIHIKMGDNVLEL